MLPEEKIPLADLVLSLSDIIDLVSPKLAGHHLEVAYIAGELAGECGCTPRERAELVAAGALHDIGALSVTEKLSALEFEACNPHRHAEMGCRLLKGFGPFSAEAELIRYHHVRWDGGAGGEFNGGRVPPGSHLLHLADRISALRKRDGHVLNQADGIRERIAGEAGKMFRPELVEAFLRLSVKQYFWLNAASPGPEAALFQDLELPVLSLGACELLSLTELFARIIDFRSKFTATHSAGVSAVSRALGELAGFPGPDCRRLEIAGYLHDLGKLVVPAEILEKPGKLTREEFNVVYAHPFFTRRALQRIKGFGVINAWASDHHERLTGGGYPYHRPAAELEPGARMVAVADVFTAILEDRPYQKDMSLATALAIIRKMAADRELDADAAELLRRNSGMIDHVRAQAQAAAAQAYRVFNTGLS